MRSISTITFFKFHSFQDKFWALKMMQLAHPDLRQVRGQTFYKLMGSGKGKGFNPWPDWSVYSLLQVWRSEADAVNFMETSPLMDAYRDHATEVWTLFMRPIQAKGEWSGQNPFEEVSRPDPSVSELAVITRATIKPSKLLAFWRYVPTSQKPLSALKGLIYTKGIGEVPVLQMATFSLWSGPKALQEFAYRSEEHRSAIAKTRELQWYREELFARFQPLRSVGTWGGVDPLSVASPEKVKEKQ